MTNYTFREWLENNQPITRLFVFDFDGTLVYTPEKPEGHKGGWWGKALSLLPPHLPEQLEERHLNPKVALAYKKSTQSPDTFTVMMTGRHSGLRNHVLDILKKAYGIEPHNNPGRERAYFVDDQDTLQTKIRYLQELLNEFPEVTEIEMWEDRPTHVSAFYDFGKQLKLQRPGFRGLAVHSPPNW